MRWERVQLSTPMPSPGREGDPMPSADLVFSLSYVILRAV